MNFKWLLTFQANIMIIMVQRDSFILDVGKRQVPETFNGRLSESCHLKNRCVGLWICPLPNSNGKTWGLRHIPYSMLWYLRLPGTRNAVLDVIIRLLLYTELHYFLFQCYCDMSTVVGLRDRWDQRSQTKPWIIHVFTGLGRMWVTGCMVLSPFGHVDCCPRLKNRPQ